MRILSLPILLLLLNWTPATAAVEAQQPVRESQTSFTSSLVKLHENLISHESITENEHGVAQYLISYLKDKNFTVESQEVTAKTKTTSRRENVFAYVGEPRKTRVLVSSHIDTVPPYWKYERKGDEIWGRGSVDAKGSVAAQIIAVEELLGARSIGEGDVALLFVVGEETGGDGMRKANDLGLKWESCIFGEPTELKLASGHKGILSCQIKAKGKAGHSGYPELGKSANAMLIPTLSALLSAPLPWSEKYGNTTLNIGKIQGGVAANVIAEDAIAEIAIRIAEGEPAGVEKIILDTVQKVGEDLDVIFHKGYGPVDIDIDVPGFDSMTVNYGTDIPNLKGDHKRYLYGPGSILMAHSDHEHLRVSDLEAAVEGYKTLIKHSLKYN